MGQRMVAQTPYVVRNISIRKCMVARAPQHSKHIAEIYADFNICQLHPFLQWSCPACSAGKGLLPMAGLDSGGAFCHMASSAAALCVSDLSSPHELPGRSSPSSGEVTQLMLAAGDLVGCLAASANGGPTGVPACVACVASPAVQLQGLAVGASCANPRSTLSTQGSPAVRQSKCQQT